MYVWGELVPSKIFNPPFPVLKAGHSVSYSCICDVCREWVNKVGFFLFFLKIPVWLVCYVHGFHVYIYTATLYGLIALCINVYAYMYCNTNLLRHLSKVVYERNSGTFLDWIVNLVNI